MQSGDEANRNTPGATAGHPWARERIRNAFMLFYDKVPLPTSTGATQNATASTDVTQKDAAASQQLIVQQPAAAASAAAGMPMIQFCLADASPAYTW